MSHGPEHQDGAQLPVLGLQAAVAWSPKGRLSSRGVQGAHRQPKQKLAAVQAPIQQGLAGGKQECKVMPGRNSLQCQRSADSCRRDHCSMESEALERYYMPPQKPGTHCNAQSLCCSRSQSARTGRKVWLGCRTRPRPWSRCGTCCRSAALWACCSWSCATPPLRRPWRICLPSPCWSALLTRHLWLD